jgi:conjugal transfer/entry exclusion protein
MKLGIQAQIKQYADQLEMSVNYAKNLALSNSNQIKEIKQEVAKYRSIVEDMFTKYEYDHSSLVQFK